MINKEQIINGYSLAKAEYAKYERLLDLYKQAYRLYQKMEYLAEKYPDLMFSNCPERKNKEVPLAFCIEKCTGKCHEWVTIRKHQPRLLEVVTKLNTRYVEIVRKIEEIR